MAKKAIEISGRDPHDEKTLDIEAVIAAKTAENQPKRGRGRPKLERSEADIRAVAAERQRRRRERLRVEAAFSRDTSGHADTDAVATMRAEVATLRQQVEILEKEKTNKYFVTERRHGKIVMTPDIVAEAVWAAWRDRCTEQGRFVTIQMAMSIALAAIEEVSPPAGSELQQARTDAIRAIRRAIDCATRGAAGDGAGDGPIWKIAEILDAARRQIEAEAAPEDDAMRQRSAEAIRTAASSLRAIDDEPEPTSISVLTDRLESSARSLSMPLHHRDGGQMAMGQCVRWIRNTY